MMESAINQNLLALAKSHEEEKKILKEIRDMLRDMRAEQVMKQTEEAMKQEGIHLQIEEEW